MNTILDREAERYLAPCRDGWFWAWSPVGDVIAWRDTGRAIAFRQEVRAVLERLSDAGLPPLDSIVLLLAACRDNWPIVLNQEVRFLAAHTDAQFVADLLAKLGRVHALPAALRSTPQAKAHLAQTVFETCRQRTASVLTARILTHFRENRPLETIRRNVVQSTGQILKSTLAALSRGLEGVDEETLRLRAATGLDQLVAPAAIELPASARARQLLSELQHDENLAGLARLTLDLMATVPSSRTSLDEQELPTGGLGDISNRGQLDRLLLTELASDELTFAARVALNEALYYRRENPATSHPIHRAILLDAGIRMWGVPRVFATAVALAAIATGGRKASALVYRAQGARAVPVDLLSRSGLEEQLRVLETDAHPGQALADFCRQVCSEIEHVDFVIITGTDVARDADFLRALQEHGPFEHFLATVQWNGHFTFQWRSGQHHRVVAEANLDLEAMLARPKSLRSPPLLVPIRRDALPAILEHNPFPLRVGNAPRDKEGWREWSVPDRAILAITPDRRLLYWQRGNRGPLQLSDTCPRGVLHCVCPVRDDTTRVVFGPRGGEYLYLLSVNLSSLSVDCLPFISDARDVLRVSYHGGAILVIRERSAEAYDLHGNFLDGARLLHAVRSTGRQNGRFVIKDDVWWALSYDGQKLRLDEVTDANGDTLPREGFLCSNLAGDPFFVGPRGNIFIFSAANRSWIVKDPVFNGDVVVEAVSHDGSTVVIRAARELSVGKPRTAERGTPPGNYAMKMGHPPRPLSVAEVKSAEVHANRAIHPFFTVAQRLRCCFREVRVTTDGELILVSKHGGWAFTLDRPSDCIRLQRWRPDGPVGTRPKMVRSHRFVRIAEWPKGSYLLRVAAMEDKSQVFLDSRGLLHLKSADRQIPQLSIVLVNDDLDIFRQGCAGWCEDGRVWGAKMFHADLDATPVSAASIYEQIIRPFARSVT